MKLQAGERLAGTGTATQPGGYVVSEVLRETPYLGFYVGRKIQYNFDFSSKRVRETDDREWLEVLLRTLRYPHLEDADDVAWRRRMVREEVRFILGRSGNRSWPQPLDLLEMDRPRDSFAFATRDPEPILVLARPHGLTLADWQQQVVPLATILTVLAEILVFIEQSHAQGWVLQGLGPGAIIVDRAGRTHYLASDLTLDPRRFAAAAGPSAVTRWSRLFPADRFPRGFAAPELFQPTRLPEGRADLYSWGWLVYGLLAGQQAWHIALEQGRPWAQYQPAHATRLERTLQQIPPAFLRDWADQLGVEANDLVAEWPTRFLAVLSKVLHFDPAQRPESVAQFREWLRKPPPPPLRAMLAAYQGDGSAQILLDSAGAPGEDVATIRRWVGEPPADPSEGAKVYEGPLVPQLVDSHVPIVDRPIYYAGFLRDRAGSSSAVVTRLTRATLDNVRRHADSLAEETPDDALPPVLRLYARLLGPIPVADAMLSSEHTLARRWGLAQLRDLLEQPLQATPAAERLETLLSDPAESIRHEAAALLWPLETSKTDDRLLSLLRRAGPGGADDSLRALVALRPRIDDSQYRRVLAVLEGEKPTQCPVCKVQLSARDRDLHLRTAHGYAEVDRSMLPRPIAVGRLWEKTFADGDLSAHRRLAELLDGTNYATSLERELLRRHMLTPPDPADPRSSGQGTSWRWIDAAREGVKRHRETLPRLLVASDERLRRFGEAIGAAYIAEELGSKAIDGDGLRKSLEDAAPGPALLEERMAIAERLAAMGIASAAVEACLRSLERDRPIPCPECAARVPAGEFETHLRQAHQVFQFRGVRRSYAATREAMLDALFDALFASSFDPNLWRQAESLAVDRHGEQADRRFATWLCLRLKRLPRPDRPTVMPQVAGAAAASPRVDRLIGGLLAQEAGALEQIGRQLAAQIGARATALPKETVATLTPLIGDKAIPRSIREDLLASLLRQVHGEKKAVELLRKFVEGSGKLRGIERLDRLELRVGRMAAIDEVRGALQQRVRMNCPRCGIELQQRDMLNHLWDRHRLVLDQQRVREPWRVLADWVVDYRLEKDQAILERCKELALRSDPRDGIGRLHRLLLSQGVDDAEGRRQLLASIQGKPRSLCPHCFTDHASSRVSETPPLITDGESMSGYGYRLRWEDRGLVPQIRMSRPDGSVEILRPPGYWLTAHAKAAVALVPMTAVAFVALRIALPEETLELLVALLSLGISLVLAGAGYWLGSGPISERQWIDLAWEVLVPSLLKNEHLEWAVLGGLARASIGKGNAQVRSQNLTRCLRRGADVQDEDAVAISALGSLLQLEARDAERRGDDPVPFVAEHLSNLLRGSFPLGACRHLLGSLHETWPTDRRLRTAVLVTELADNDSLPQDLADLQQAAPEARAFFGDHLFERSLAWTVLRRSFLDGDWHERAPTIFDLAKSASTPKFAEKADVLLAQKTTQGNICVERDGVRFADLLWTALPRSIEVAARAGERRTQYEVVIDGQSLWFRRDPSRTIAVWREWMEFWVSHFRPRLMEAEQTGIAGSRAWRRRAARLCDECGRSFLPVPAGIGLPIDANDEARKPSRALKTEKPT
ncbi:MAG: hypothetical protein K2X38_16875 [Gemmataceae bacterium]|nr:hypothetical protein [Gemmataceae bacterium]